MKIIEQSHEVITISRHACETIERVARTCYKSEDKITKDSSKHFVKMLNRRGHGAMLEFADITVRFITNRGISHELVRHRLASFAQESTRYVRYDGGMEVIRPVWWNHDEMTGAQETWIRAVRQAEQAYQQLLSHGWRPEQAREVLPNSLKTEIVVKANIREWQHILTLRCSKKAHPQMRALMIPLLNEFTKYYPELFKEIKDVIK